MTLPTLKQMIKEEFREKFTPHPITKGVYVTNKPGYTMETFLDEVVDRVAEATAKATKLKEIKKHIMDDGKTPTCYACDYNEAVAQ
jgi:hypothetical protein